MSPFGTEEVLQQGSRPLYLYEFQLGLDIWRYNSTESTLDSGGQTWEGSSGAHSEPELSPEGRTKTFTVLLPATSTFIGGFVKRKPAEKAVVLISRVHRGDLADPELFFQGVVRNVKWGANTKSAKAICLPVEGRFNKSIPRLGYSAQCPLMLYDDRCKVNRSLHLYNGTASAVSGDTLVVSGLDGGGRGAGWATSGEAVILSSGERRTVRLHAATDTLTLMFPFDVNVNGEAVEVAAGCNRSVATCNSKFNAILDYGGTPHIPTENIFVQGLK